jgi:hypothetical protein
MSHACLLSGSMVPEGDHFRSETGRMPHVVVSTWDNAEKRVS